jgi:CCR4-NOT transcriptional regulation complex NOT5 subunit
MYSTIIYGKGRNESFIKVQEILGQKQNGAQEDKYQHHIKNQIKTLNSNTDPYKIWVNSGASERLAVPASCTTPPCC